MHENRVTDNTVVSRIWTLNEGLKTMHLSQVYKTTRGWFTYIRSGTECCSTSSEQQTYTSGFKQVYREGLDGKIIL